MFGRKARRIKELELELEYVKENLGVAVVPAWGFTQRIEVRKGQWYNFAYKFRHTGAETLDLSDLVLTSASNLPDYFDGETSNHEEGRSR